MTKTLPDETQIMKAIAEALHSIAPEIDVSTIHLEEPLRDQVELDSMDFFNLMVGIHRKLGVDIPESDYPRLSTLKNCILYLQEKLLKA